MTKDQRAYLEIFTPETYGIYIPRPLARQMERKGWIEWVPPKFGTQLYSITAAGRNALQS